MGLNTSKFVSKGAPTLHKFFTNTELKYDYIKKFGYLEMSQINDFITIKKVYFIKVNDVYKIKEENLINVEHMNDLNSPKFKENMDELLKIYDKYSLFDGHEKIMYKREEEGSEFLIEHKEAVKLLTPIQLNNNSITYEKNFFGLESLQNNDKN